MASTLTRMRQDHIWTLGSGITDNLTPTSHDASAVSLQDTIDYIASQLADITGETTWEAAPDLSIATMAARTWLSDVKRIRSRLLLHDITIPAEVAAGGTLTVVSGAELIDGELFVLNDGVNAAVTFEYDSNASVVETPTLRAVVFTAGDSAATVHAATRAAINAAPTLAITAAAGGSPVLTLTNDVKGSFGNIPISSTIADSDWAVTGMTGGAGDMVVLSVAGTDVPATRNISLATTTSGMVCAQLSTLVGRASLTDITGDNALTPNNICMVINGSTGDPVTSSARKVYALLQAESTATDGLAPDDATNQLQLTFVRPNATYDDLELCPAADVQGLSINYSYPDRESLHLWSQGDFRRDTVLVDLSASAISVTLDTAYDGGSLVNVDSTDVDFRLTDGRLFEVRNSTGTDEIFAVVAKATTGGDAIRMLAPGGVTILGDVDGSTYDATWNGVTVGSAAGTVSTASGDLTLSAATDLEFVTTRQTALPLDDATAGPISALAGQTFASVSAAIKYAIEHGTFNLGVHVCPAPIARNTNIPAGTGGLSLASPHSLDMNTPSGVDTLVFWNRGLALGGNGTDMNDVYVGTTPANGDIMVDHPGGVKAGDVFIALQFSTT